MHYVFVGVVLSLKATLALVLLLWNHLSPELWLVGPQHWAERKPPVLQEIGARSVRGEAGLLTAGGPFGDVCSGPATVNV